MVNCSVGVGDLIPSLKTLNSGMVNCSMGPGNMILHVNHNSSAVNCSMVHRSGWGEKLLYIVYIIQYGIHKYD